jgi:hypothetical protein
MAPQRVSLLSSLRSSCFSERLWWEVRTWQVQDAQWFIAILATLTSNCSAKLPLSTQRGLWRVCVSCDPTKKLLLCVISSHVGFAWEAGQQADPQQLQVLSFLRHPSSWCLCSTFDRATTQSLAILEACKSLAETQEWPGWDAWTLGTMISCWVLGWQPGKGDKFSSELSSTPVGFWGIFVTSFP